MGNLYRTAGAEDSIIGERNVSRLFEQVHIGNISWPQASYKDTEQNMEEMHNRVHRWVGGDMITTETSAQDPVFYIYHAWIDLLYTMFRQHQRANGVDPETDWALDYGQARHHRYSPMGLGSLMAIDGANEIFAENIRYADRPTCSYKQTNCGTPYLYCNVTVEKCVPWTAKEYRNIQDMAERNFVSFDIEAAMAIQIKIQQGVEEVELLTAETTAIKTTINTTQASVVTTTKQADMVIIDHDHTHHIVEDDHADMTDNTSHKHAGHLDPFVDKYLSLVILAALFVIRVLFCICSKCCSSNKKRVRRRSRKYKLSGIVNVNYSEDRNKASTTAGTEDRPDNIYTITETCHDTSTLGHTTYVRFSRYIVGRDKDGDENDKGLEDNENRTNDAEIKQDDTQNKEGAIGHKYVKSGKKSSSIKYRQKKDPGETADMPDNDPEDDYMDMTFASKIIQSERNLSEDIYERETNTSDADSDDGADGEATFARLSSVENENYELPVETTENSFAFLDDYDNVDFIREALNRDMIEEESHRMESIVDCESREYPGDAYTDSHSAHI